MPRLYCIAFFLGSLFNTYADSTYRHTLKFKGIDVSLGSCSYNFGHVQYGLHSQNFLSSEIAGRYNFDHACADQYRQDVVKPSVNIIWGTDKVHYRNPIFHKYEYNFGFTYGVTPGHHIDVKNIESQYSSSIKLKADYVYKEQVFHAGVKTSTKAIKGVLAFYMGANAVFGVSRFKTYGTDNAIDNTGFDESAFSKTVSGIYGVAGLKYNLSCEINLFGQYEGGFVYLSGAPYATTFSGLSIGIRYKFLEEENRKFYQNSSMW